MSELSCPKCGESPMFRSVVHECCEKVTDLGHRIAAVMALPTREWDENDADSAEARSARAYNHALAKAKAALSDA